MCDLRISAARSPMMTQGAGVAGCYAGMIDPSATQRSCIPKYFQRAGDRRHGVLVHLGGAGLVPVAHGGIRVEALEFGTFEVCLA
jgi:hypothetical protein